MSKSTKFKLEIVTVYTALAVTFLCMVAIQTIIISSAVNGKQNQQYQTQSTTVSRDQDQSSKTTTVQARQ